MSDIDEKDVKQDAHVKVVKPAKRAARKTRQRVMPRRFDEMPEPLDFPREEGPIERKENRLPAPRISNWICREDVVWNRPYDGYITSILYRKGEVVEVGWQAHETPKRFDFARGFWYPEGEKVVDPKTMKVIPMQFEPIHPDGKDATRQLWAKLLVDVRKINYARNHIQIGKLGTPFHFKSELDLIEVNLDNIPEPLTLEEMAKPKEIPEKFAPAELSAKGFGMR